MSTDENKPRKVLVAEDESLIRLDIVETLTAAGFDVVAEASDGEEAVRLALEPDNEDDTPDLCVMDVKMPKMDGITAAEKILRELSCAVVMLTAFSQKELVERARDAGAMAYVVKPFSPAVEIALSRHREIESLEEEISDMSERFETRKRVDRAKGLLMEKMDMTEPEAFRWIQKTSMDRRLSMREVADAVIDQVDD